MVQGRSMHVERRGPGPLNRQEKSALCRYAALINRISDRSCTKIIVNGYLDKSINRLGFGFREPRYMIHGGDLWDPGIEGDLMKPDVDPEDDILLDKFLRR